MAWRTKKMLKSFLIEYYDGDQARGLELLGNMIFEVHSESFYEDNEITKMYFILDNMVKSAKYGEIGVELEYKKKFS